MAAQALGAGLSKRSETALEGIALLRRGSVVKKYGRQGKPHAVTFRLLDDLRTLSWERSGIGSKLSGLGKWGGGGDKVRSVQLDEMVEILVGESRARTLASKQASSKRGACALAR